MQKQSPFRRWFDLRILLLLIPAGIYANSLFGDFVYDDKELTVENNPALSGEASFWEIMSWDRPLREFTYLFDHALWGFNPLGYHLQNLVWHCANTLLFFTLLQSLGLALTESFWIALFFSIHPVNTESVAWISGRKELLCLFFELAACLFFLRAYRQNRIKSWSYLACLIACILALLSKQTAAALPLLLAFLAMFYQREAKLTHYYRQALRFLAAPGLIVLAFLLFRYPVFEQLGFTRESGMFYDPGARDVAYTFTAALLTPFATLLKSVELCVWPMDLSVEHAYPPVTTFTDLRWLAGAAAGIALIGLAWIWRRERPVFLLGLAWFFAAWIPVSGAAPVSYLVADRYLYIPCAGFCLATVAALQPLLRRCESKIPHFTVLSGVTVCLFFSIRTIERNCDWRNEILLWQSALQANPNNAKAHSGLASAYADARETEKAFAEWNRSLELDPNQPRIWVNMGNEEKRRNNAEAAERNYRKALELFPDYGAAHFNLALLLEEQNKIDDALRHFQLAAQHLYHRINTDQRKGMAHYHIARILYSKGDRQTALYQIAYAEKLAAVYAPIYVLKGMLQSNDPLLARQSFTEAIHLDPNSPDAYFNLGVLEWRLGNRETAEASWKKAVERQPSLLQQIERIKK